MRQKKIVGMLTVSMLLIVAFAIMATPVSAGASNQKIEFEHGTYERVYPMLTMPSSCECGPDSDDIILQYNTYWGTRVDPDDVRWSSDLWWVRWYINLVYPDGLSANGLDSTTTRVCMGMRGQTLGLDLELLYLWHK